MEKTAQPTTLEEPVGIVISRGSREEAEPRFRAYVWSDEVVRDEPVKPVQRAA